MLDERATMGLIFAVQTAGAVILALSVCGAIFALLATMATWRFLRRAPAAPVGLPALTLLRPLHGDEPEPYSSRTGLSAQGYAAPVQLLCGGPDRADPAAAAVRRLQLEHPESDIVLV